jgi:RNA polymerase sigma factor FliA
VPDLDYEFVRRVTHYVARKVPANIQFEDLVQAGAVGYLEAAASYDPAKGASLNTHAFHRVQGAVKDELRRSDWTPRSVRRAAREIAQTARNIETRELRPALHHEIAAALNLSTEKYHQALADIHVGQPDSIEDLHASPTPEPTEALETNTLHHALRAAIHRLPPRHQQILALRYQHDWTWNAIGDALDVCGPRVHQIHAAILARLRSALRDWRAPQPEGLT